MAVRRFQTPFTSSKVGRGESPCSASQLRRSVATQILRLPLSSDDHDPSDMSDRRKRPMLPHIQVTRRSDRQDSFDQPKRHTAPNRPMRHLRTDHQRRAIRKIPIIRYSPTNQHNRHCLVTRPAKKGSQISVAEAASFGPTLAASATTLAASATTLPASATTLAASDRRWQHRQRHTTTLYPTPYSRDVYLGFWNSTGDHIHSSAGVTNPSGLDSPVPTREGRL